MAPPCPILAGYRLVAPGPCACFPFKFVQESACCSCVCATWRLSVCVSWPFMRAFFWSFAPIRSWASYDNGLYISLAHFWFSLLPAALTCNSCRNDSILLNPFLGKPFYSFSQWPITGTVLFFFLYSWAPMSLWVFLLGIHGPFANPFGLSQPVC